MSVANLVTRGRLSGDFASIVTRGWASSYWAPAPPIVTVAVPRGIDIFDLRRQLQEPVYEEPRVEIEEAEPEYMTMDLGPLLSSVKKKMQILDIDENVLDSNVDVEKYLETIRRLESEIVMLKSIVRTYEINNEIVLRTLSKMDTTIVRAKYNAHMIINRLKQEVLHERLRYKVVMHKLKREEMEKVVLVGVTSAVIGGVGAYALCKYLKTSRRKQRRYRYT